MAVNRQKIWQINFNKYNAVGGGLKCCHPLNYKNTTVNQSPPHVGEVMEMCHRENLYQIDLLHGSKNRVTEREYWAKRKGQAALDKENVSLGI